MSGLILGPVLRYVDETSATVWVETDGACEVEILGHRAATFCLDGHHYAVVVIRGLAPATRTPYEVHLDGVRCWPRPDDGLPPPAIRTHGGPARARRVVLGSCRVCAPHEPPYTLSKGEHPDGREVDSLRLLGARFARDPPDDWPDLVLHLGDQVYADEVSPRTLAFLRARRDTSEPPYEQVADFEEYTHLYRESWGEPLARWMLSVIPSAMIFDDHDVIDDWNISRSWREEMWETDWWEDRIAGAFMSYWVYQHLGNLSPDELERDRIFARVHESDGDASALLREFALTSDRHPETTRWSFTRHLPGARIVVLDSRAGRQLTPERRRMLDDDEWAWAESQLVGDVDHLIVGSSLPVLLAKGLHYGEAWNEAVCDGAWGAVAARLGERLRRGADLEHWPAFGDSFALLMRRLAEVGAGLHGRAPETITIVSGDVHHAYVAAAAFRRELEVSSAVWQVTCSPFRNPLGPKEQRVIRFGFSRTGHVVGRTLARLAGVPDPDLRWRIADGPVFDNQVATLDIDGPRLRLSIERARAGSGSGADDPENLEVSLRRDLGGAAGAPMMGR